MTSGYDPGPHHGSSPGLRPWWGLGDLALSVPFLVVVLAIGTVAAAAIAVASGVDLGDIAEDTPPALIVVPTLIQQVAMFAYPFVVSRWKGLGAERDWGWAFKPIDLASGVGVAFMAIFAAGVAQTGVAALLDVEDAATTTNTQIVNDFEGSPWLIGLIVVVVIGAPFSEEIFFRGSSSALSRNGGAQPPVSSSRPCSSLRYTLPTAGSSPEASWRSGPRCSASVRFSRWPRFSPTGWRPRSWPTSS